MKKYLLLSAGFLLGFLFYSFISQQINPRESPSKYKNEATFNFDPNEHHLIIPVVINNKQYDFIVDTGSSIIVFGESLKSELGKYSCEKEITNFYREHVPISVYETPKQLKVGPYSIKGEIAYHESSEKLDFSPCDGILGLNFLKNYIVKIDFDDSTITIYKNHDINDIKVGLPIDITYDSCGLPTLNLKVNGVETQLACDSGYNNYAVLSEEVFEKVADQEGISIFNIEEHPLSKFREITIVPAISGTLQLNSFDYENIHFWKGKISLLGMDFMELHKCVIFDFPNGKIYLSPKIKTVNDININGLGIILGYQNNVLAVKSIETDSNAYQAGLRENDIILKIEDVNMNLESLLELPELFIEINKDSMDILIRRSSDDFVITCPIKKKAPGAFNLNIL